MWRNPPWIPGKRASTMKQIAISIDLEPDYPPYLGPSYLCVEDATPKLLDLLHSENVPASVFMLAELCDPFPSLAKEIVQKDFHLGNHGLRHRALCAEDEETQWNDLSESTRILQENSGRRMTAFRAPNFSIGGYALSCLEKLGYGLDSSILPGRRMQKWLHRKVYDFRGAPMSPYHPSAGDIKKPGSLRILEIPATENPLRRQRPIGGGFLNLYGPAETLKVIEMVDLPIVVLVFHPWEFIDMWGRFPRLPSWMRQGCRANLPALSELIGGLKNEGHRFTDLDQLAENLEHAPIGTSVAH